MRSRGGYPTCFHGGAIQPAFTPPLTIHRARASADKPHPCWRSTLTLNFSGLGFFEPSGLAQQPLSFSDRLARTWCCGIHGGRAAQARGSERSAGRPPVANARCGLCKSKRGSERFGFGTKWQGWQRHRKEEGACPGSAWGLNGKVGHVRLEFNSRRRPLRSSPFDGRGAHPRIWHESCRSPLKFA